MHSSTALPMELGVSALRSLLPSQPQRVPALCWEEWGQSRGGLLGAPSAPQTRGERERGGKGIRAEDKVIPPEKAMSHLHCGYRSPIPERREQGGGRRKQLLLGATKGEEM